MQLFFIRHGQSENNALWEQTGSSELRSSDPELTKTGQLQAANLANFLAQSEVNQAEPNPFDIDSFGITHLYTSLMVRAVATATPIAYALHLPLVAWKNIHEEGGIYRNDLFGNPVGLPGHDRNYFSSYYPELQLPADLDDKGWWNRPFEDDTDRIARAQKVLEELLEVHGGTQDHVAMVSHGGLYNLLLQKLLKISDDCTVGFELKNTAISRIDFNNSEIEVVYLNRFDFIPPALIT